MKIISNKVILILSLFFILILSLGLVSASNNTNDLIDITYNDNRITENIEISDCDSNSANDLNQDVESNLAIDSSYSSMGIIRSDGVISSNDANDLKDIQNLIDQSNENDTITLSGTYRGDSKIIVNKSLNIVGDKSGTTFDGKFLTQILDVHSPNVLLKNIRFINSNGISVAINNKNVTINNCSFENSINGELGSALSCYGDNLKVLNSKFLNNIANKSSCHHTDGPAIYLIANNAIIDNCTFINNTGYNYETASSGGAIWLKGFNCSILNSVFINNSATSKFAWTLHGEEQTFLADGNGGAIFWVGNNGKIDNCSFINCIAHSYGGAIYFKATKGCSISNSKFIDNYAIGDGGAIYLGQNVFNLEISNSQFNGNVALGLLGVLDSYDDYGGAIFADYFVENTTVFNSSFSDNYGKGIIYYSGSNLQVSNSIFNRSNPIVENSTLERFLEVIKDSTLEEYNKKISDFALYHDSGSLFESVIFNDGSVNNNNWGDNFNNSDEFICLKLVKFNDEYIAPSFWINLMIVNQSGEGNNSTDPNTTAVKDKSVIVSKDMTTTTVYAADGKIGKYFTIRLTDSKSKALAGKRIIINFNGKDYYRTTDKNGYIKFQINLAKKGTYTIAICFLGDDNYNASFKSSKIKVNPAKAKLTTANKKYKLSLKKKTLTVKLLSPKNKPVKGKKISFRINGKTYSAKTNSKGISTVKVVLNKRKTCSFTAKFAGDNTFKAVSIKGKVIVR